MKILFAGCSLTWGAELKIRRISRYSFHVAKEFKCEEINIAEPGISNDLICKSVFEAIEFDKKVDFVVIQVTSILRFSFVYNNEYISIAPGPYTYKTDPLLKNMKLHIYSSNQNNSNWYCLSRWKLLTIHYYLKSLGIKHLFVFKDQEDADMFFDDEFVSQSFKEVFCKQALMEYCKDNNLDFGYKGHPIENSHIKIAENIILPKMKELL
jgi:hypothetical protein